MSRDWTMTEKCRPTNGEVVETMDSGGHVQDLKRENNLWWFPDGSMYVYYTPKAWRRKESDD